MHYHHNTMKSYVASLIKTFNKIEIQNQNSSGSIISKNVPIVYSTREKSKILDSLTAEQILSGNYNVLPRGNLAFTSMIKSNERTLNKNLKGNTKESEDSIDYMYNSVPYEFNYDLTIQCRGMSEVTQIIEQICPKFNPFINIDIWDANNLSEPSRIPIKLLTVDVEDDEYSEISSNLFNVIFSISIMGNLYPPIKSLSKIKEFKIRMNTYDDENVYERKSILTSTISNDSNNVTDILNIPDTVKFAPVINEINLDDSLVIGTNNLSLDYIDQDNTINELTFNWLVVNGTADISFENDKASVITTDNSDFELAVTITDIYGNFTTLNKVFAFD